MRCEFCSKTAEIHIDHFIMFKDLTNNFLKKKKHTDRF
jgi:hypothetical protein